MRFLIFCLAFVGLLVASTSLSRSDEYVKIGSWNIERLGNRRYGQHPKALSEHIQLSGVDVLALQELFDTDDAAETRTNKKLDETLAELNELDGNDWKYLIFASRVESDAGFLTGVAWNARQVALVGKPFRVGVKTDSEHVWRRNPHAVQFRVREGKTDFLLISVHMKSNIAVEGAPETTELRKREAESLAAELPAIREAFGGEKDILILGDFNCLRSDEAAVRTFVEQGFKDLNPKDRNTFVTGDAPFDRIFVPGDQPEFKYSRQYVLTPADARRHEGSLSDHYLVLTPVKVLEDDD